MEVYGERREHGERGHKDAGEEMVGHLQRRVVGLQEISGSGSHTKRRRADEYAAVPRRSLRGGSRQVRHGSIGGLNEPISLVSTKLILKKQVIKTT